MRAKFPERLLNVDPIVITRYLWFKQLRPSTEWRLSNGLQFCAYYASKNISNVRCAWLREGFLNMWDVNVFFSRVAVSLLSLCEYQASKKSFVKITSPVYNCRIVEVGYTFRCCFHFYSVVHPALYKVSWNVSCKRFAFFLINNETSRIAKGGITKLQPNKLYLLTIHKLCLVILLASNIFIVGMRQK